MTAGARSGTLPPDDAIILAYAAMGGGNRPDLDLLILIYWKQITADRKVFPWLTLAAAIGGALDGFGSPYVRLSAIAEESAEFAAGTFAVTAMRLRLASRQMTGVARERDRVALPKCLAACDNC